MLQGGVTMLKAVSREESSQRRQDRAIAPNPRVLARSLNSRLLIIYLPIMRLLPFWLAQRHDAVLGPLVAGQVADIAISRNPRAQLIH
jgi:hypothetical protein